MFNFRRALVRHHLSEQNKASGNQVGRPALTPPPNYPFVDGSHADMRDSHALTPGVSDSSDSSDSWGIIGQLPKTSAGVQKSITFREVRPVGARQALTPLSNRMLRTALLDILYSRTT